MKIIIITSPGYVKEEIGSIARLLDSGLIDRIHLRKPSLDEADTRRLIESISPAYRPSITIHDHLRIAKDLGIGGIHLNSRNPFPPKERFSGLISRSCHSVVELRETAMASSPPVDYCFLSPVFDSISKKGYKGSITPQDFRDMSSAGLLDERVYALSGITPERIPILKEAGFKGAAILGAAWESPSIGDFIKRLRPYL